MTRPQYNPINRMVHDAIIGAAQEAPSSAPQWIAHAMLDAYGEHTPRPLLTACRA